MEAAMKRDPAREAALRAVRCRRGIFDEGLVASVTRAIRRYARREVEAAVAAAHDNEALAGKSCTFVNGYLLALDSVRAAAIRARGGGGKGTQ